MLEVFTIRLNIHSVRWWRHCWTAHACFGIGYWLPVSYRIKFKQCCLKYCANTGISPTYITDIVHPCRFSEQRPGLRSASTSDFKPRLQSKFGERSFSYSGSLAWNDLPLPLREATSLQALRNSWKHCLTLHSANYCLVWHFIRRFYFITSFMLVMCRRPVFTVVRAIEFFYDDDGGMIWHRLLRSSRKYCIGHRQCHFSKADRIPISTNLLLGK